MSVLKLTFWHAEVGSGAISHWGSWTHDLRGLAHDRAWHWARLVRGWKDEYIDIVP